MIANMLRRSRDASLGSSEVVERRQPVPASDSKDVMVDALNSAVSTLSTTARRLSSGASPAGDPHSESRKRSRGRHAYSDAYDNPLSHAVVDLSLSHTSTPPPTKRRGRPPRDYGDELGSAFAMYANECYKQTELSILDRAGASSGTRVPKSEVLRVAWENWWLSAQGVKDKYLTLSRHEMTVNETHMLELLLEYPLPNGALAAQASHRHAPPPNPSRSRSPDPVGSFDAFLSEQIPLLRSKVPDWSDSEIHRRLAVNWNNMTVEDRERYSSAALNSGSAASANGSASHRNYPASTSQRLTPRARTQSAPRRAYVLFCRQERPVLVGDNPEWDLPTVNKELGRRWKDLPPDQREVYYAMEKKEAESRLSGGDNPSAQHASFAPSDLGPDNGSSPNGPTAGSSSAVHIPTYQKPGGYFAGVPTTPTNGKHPHSSGTLSNGRPGSAGLGYPNKGPSKAYVYYSRLIRRSVTDSHREWDLATVNRELGRMWKTLPPDERQMWENRAAAAAAAGDPILSNPRRRASPASFAHPLSAPDATTPSPLPSTAAVSGDTSNTSMPVTPVSGSATPMSRDDSVALLHHREYDGESEAEDVEMQDDETESEEAHAPQSQNRMASSISAYPSSAHHNTTRPLALGSVSPPTESLPKYNGAQGTSASRPPPTAKPAAVIASSNDTSPASLDAAIHEPSSPKPSI
ncbi:hypothetical protein H4218_002095 [Coemansia sp. IMI 209128]|nr:hypothetical protein GGI10_004082 [Coemansia sp. RSA 2530]KAJ2700362.1 hypothetical protein H4218_002095 [Coemansia sp. IMI 209128]